MADTEEVPTSYEDLAQIEHEFDDVDTEISPSLLTASTYIHLLMPSQCADNTP